MREGPGSGERQQVAPESRHKAACVARARRCNATRGLHSLVAPHERRVVITSTTKPARCANTIRNGARDDMEAEAWPRPGEVADRGIQRPFGPSGTGLGGAAWAKTSEACASQLLYTHSRQQGARKDLSQNDYRSPEEVRMPAVCEHRHAGECAPVCAHMHS